MAVLFVASWACMGLMAYQDTRPVRGPLAAITRPATKPAATQPVQAGPQITISKDGPWGRMEVVPLVLELPDPYAVAEQAMRVHDRWTFAGQTQQTARSVLIACGLSSEQLSAMAGATWASTATGVSVEPPDAVILSLTPACRAALYGRLMSDPANKSSVDPMWFRDGRVDFRLRGSGLSEASVALLKRLLYASPDEPSTLLFADLKPAIRAIDDPAERQRFLKAVTRKRSLVARLFVDSDTDTAALSRYWGRGGREDNLQPLLDSLKFNAISGVERPGKINVVTLLPPFVQERLYRHAEATTPAGRTPDDCFWTAFNFFSDSPDDRFHDAAYLMQALPREYMPIDEPTQLGDVIILAAPNGEAIHAANYVADDIVFTKNGMSRRQPWILVPMRDLLTQYRIKNPTMTIACFRKR